MVEILRFCAWPIERIALTIGCSEGTLRDRFADELTFGADRKHAQLVDALFRSAERGSAAAARFLREQGYDFDASKMMKHRRRRPPLRGKKARADRAARTPGAAWADLVEPPEKLN